MTKNLQVSIKLDGHPLSAFSSISINQEFNAHHTFEVVVNHDVLEQFGSSSLEVSKKYMGKFINISFGEKEVSEHTFRGIVTEISMVQSRGAWANISLKGYSPTYLLEGDSHYSSYYKKNLQAIVDDAVKNMPGNAMPCAIKPLFSKTIPYMCQYKESHFQFINRLAAEYGEWFYYDGEKLIFGKPSDQPKVNLHYGEDLEDMSLSLRVVPANITHYSYNSGEDKVLTSPSPGNAEGANSYAKHALSVSDDLYFKPVKQTPLIRTSTGEDLDNYAKQQKERQASNTVLLRAQGSNPKVKIGSKVTISEVTKATGKENTLQHGEYLVTGINHYITGTCKYSHSLEALPAVIKVLPVQLSKPLAETQMAIVKENKDPDGQGRVRVQMLWQQEKGDMTDWLRVLTPDAGSSDKVSKNRGFVFIPEKGDQVIVGFRYNDPNRPFVMGSMFHGKIGGGGGEGNKSKSLTTRSGSTLTLDDDKGNITISDPSGNVVTLNGDGTITINAPDKIDINSKEININGKDLITLNSKEIKIDGTSKVTTSSQTVETTGKAKVSITSNAQVEVGAPSTSIEGKATLKIKSVLVDIDGTAMTNVKGGLLNLNCG